MAVGATTRATACTAMTQMGHFTYIVSTLSQHKLSRLRLAERSLSTIEGPNALAAAEEPVHLSLYRPAQKIS
jgi:hypothetical protein